MRNRLQSILDKIEDIEYFVSQKNGKIMLALEDRTLKPAINSKMKMNLNFYQKLIKMT